MIRNAIGIGFLLLFGLAGFFGWRTFTEQRREADEARQKLREQQAVIERLTSARRVAQAIVLRRWTEADGVPRQRVRFVEVDSTGKELDRKEGVVAGDDVYFDALVLKFDSAKVAEGDPMKGKSLLLFRRMFGDRQKPSEGIKLDESEADGVPDAYRTSANPSQVELELWSRFWELANDPKAAAAEGVRNAQGEAPYTRMEEGKLYNLSLDTNGGLNISASDVPSVLMERER